MSAIMQGAWELYQRVSEDVGQTLLQHHEVISALSLHAFVDIEELYGTSIQNLVCAEMKFHLIDDLRDLLKNDTALIMTAQDRTTCLVQTDGEIFAFDPHIATVTHLHNKIDVQKYVSHKYPNCIEMTLSLFSVKS